MTETYTYAVYRQDNGRGERKRVATRDEHGKLSAELPDPVAQRLESCARAEDEHHDFLWHPNPEVQARAIERHHWFFERQKGKPAPHKPQAAPSGTQGQQPPPAAA